MHGVFCRGRLLVHPTSHQQLWGHNTTRCTPIKVFRSQTPGDVMEIMAVVMRRDEKTRLLHLQQLLLHLLVLLLLILVLLGRLHKVVHPHHCCRPPMGVGLSVPQLHLDVVVEVGGEGILSIRTILHPPNSRQ